jgi:hypothetical protein
MTLAHILDGAIDNAEEYGIQINAEYIDDYAFNSMGIVLTPEQINKIMLHCDAYLSYEGPAFVNSYDNMMSELNIEA